MEIDWFCLAGPEQAATEAAEAERLGFSGFMVAEAQFDPMIHLAVAAAATERLTLGTSIAIAFGRSPMALAMSAYGIQRLSGGRLRLGIGSQIKPHITRRYAMPWSAPAARMREYLGALTAIWASWQTGEPLDFRGEFYSHTLMTPMFDPGPIAGGPPEVWLAAVGPLMTEVAVELAAGLICHPLSSASYLRECTLPRVAARSGDGPFTTSGMALVATGRDQPEWDASLHATRMQIAFYASTPAYLPILRHHGWDAAQPHLMTLSRRGEWEQMADWVDDEKLETFAVVSEPQNVPAELSRRFGGALDRVTPVLPGVAGAELYRAFTLDARPLVA